MQKLYRSSYMKRITRNLLNLVIMGCVLIGIFLPSSISSALPLGKWADRVQNVSAASESDWTQEGHDAQHTGFTSEQPQEPWSLAWTWNGPDASGGTGGHFYNAPKDARTVTGGGSVYVPAGSAGIYALRKSDGVQVWHLANVTFNGTPAYDPATGNLFAAGADGCLYKIDSLTGNVLGTYVSGSGINKAVLLVGGSVYVVTDRGDLHKINTSDMTRAWVYAGGANGSTPAAYSANTGLLIFATADLYVHAVHEGNGTAQWRVKPTSLPAQPPNTFDGFWPVVAEQHGLVFVRLNLGSEALFTGTAQGTSGGGVYPSTNAETRALLLNNNGALQNLFALNLSDGTKQFIPAVGYGGTEFIDNPRTGVYLLSGPVPVVKVNNDGSEVAYIPFRTGQGNPPDGRWDSQMGEMVLDSTTIPGLAAGDMRFVSFPNSYVKITDEQTPFTMAGNTLFHAHWGASESTTILDRSPGLGLNISSPITSQAQAPVIRRQQACSNFDSVTHKTTCGLTLYGDGRYWNGPGFWVYWNAYDPPYAGGSAYSDGLLPRFTYVSSGLMIVEGNGGDLTVFRYGASVGTPTPVRTPTATSSPQASSTPTATRTPTQVLSPTIPPPTSTRTNTPTSTSLPPTATATATVPPPTSTRTNTPTSTSLPPTATVTATIPPPTSTRTNTPTSTSLPPTATATATVPPSTPTRTRTATSTPLSPTATLPASATPTSQPPTSTRTPTKTVTVTQTAQPTPTAGLSTFTLKTSGDFKTTGAALSNIYISDLYGGSLVLTGAASDHFDGAVLDNGLWSTGSWGVSVDSPTQSNSLLTEPGNSYVRSQNTYTHGAFDGIAQFGPGAWQHIGFGSDAFSGNRFILFSTANGDGNLYARVNNNASEQRVNLGPIPGGMHSYRIEWTSVNAGTDRAVFYKDGSLVAQMTFSSVGASGWYLYLSNGSAGSLVVDQAQVTPPFNLNGTYTTKSMDAGAGSAWQSVSWITNVPLGTGLAVRVRTSSDGSAWTGWNLLASSGYALAQPSRYVQLQLSLSTTNAQISPLLTSLTLYKTPGGIPGTVTATASATLSPTPTKTATRAPTVKKTVAPKPTESIPTLNPATATSIMLPSATRTGLPTATRTATATRTNIPTLAPTFTPTATRTATATNSPTSIPTATRTATRTATATSLPTLAPTAISTATRTATATSLPTSAPTATPTATRTATATNLPTSAPTATPTATRTATPTNLPTSTPTSQPSPTATSPIPSGRISGLQVVTNNPGVYDRFEVRFNVQTSALNLDMPYDPNPPSGVQAGIGVTVNALFSVDNWNTTITQPAFLYQPYTYSSVNGVDHFTPSGAPLWAVRFTPQQAGSWQYRLSVRDSLGQSIYPDQGQSALNFPVGATSINPYAAKGFIKVSASDSRYFQYQDGTPFIGVGFNDGFKDSASVEQKLNIYQQNQMNFMRVWMSGSGINGSQWTSWASNFLSQDGYLPGTSFDITNTYNGGLVSMRLDDANPCLYADFWQGGVPVEPNTIYQVSARVKLEGVSGPAAAGEYGFVIKQGGWLSQDCVKPGLGTKITTPQTGTTGWITVTGTYTTGSSDKWLGNLYLARQNASAGQVYIDEVHMYRANDPAKVDILRQPYADSVEHFSPMNAAQWDRYILSAEQHGVYLKLVIDEKNEWIRNHMEADGSMSAAGTNDNFYAASGTKVRWLQQAWWRYIIARWGYSPAVHSFEFINEGDPYNGHHYDAAEAMAKYFHQNDPSHHLVTTSFWAAFPNKEFWSNPQYADIDYADIHAYISTGWGLDASFLPSSMVEKRPAYVHSGNAAAVLDGTTQVSTSAVPRGLVIQGQGEWTIKYWMKTEGLTATCPYSGNGSMLRVRWLLDSGTYHGGKEGVIPTNSESKDYICTSRGGSFDWTQFSSTSDRDGVLLPASARIILNDNLPHELNLMLENRNGTGGKAWIDDIQILNPEGKIQPVIGQFDVTPMDDDTAWYNQAYGEVFGGGSLVGARKPLVRGETGVDFIGNQNYNPDLLKDTQGIWLHNNVWGQISVGGMADLFWWATETIPQSIFSNFATFRNFMAGIPLANGRYRDSQAQTSNTQLRVMGQRDDTAGQMHLWIQNTQHNWKRVVNGPAVNAVSGSITIPGVTTGNYKIEWWDPYATSSPIILTQTVSANGSLTITLPAPLSSDIAVKISKVP